MKAQDLMIGDWVQDLSPVIIDAISNEDICTYKCKDGYITANPSNLRPIPLTPEILEKNGFEKRISDYWVLEVVGEREYNVVAWKPQIFLQIQFTNGDLSWTNCRYVHELQHALKLCGIEKDIEL